MLNFNNETVKNVLAVVVPITFIAHVAIWTFFHPQIDDKLMQALMTLFGMHGGWTAMIVNYYFSSSASSARKDEIIANSAPPTGKP